MAIEFTDKMIDRFWAKVDKRGPNECWPWIAGKDRNGYGWFRASVCRLAHRVSYELHNGSPPVNCVLHSCDNPPCVNPAHLRDGTRAENNRDCVARGRKPRGEAHPGSKLTETIVLEIRHACANGLSERKAAAKYKLSRRWIRAIKAREAWAHI